MTQRVERSGLQVDAALAQFIDGDVLAPLGMDAGAFWQGFAALLAQYAPRNRALLDRLNAVNATLGLEPMGALDPLKRGAGDISFVAADVDSLVGLGPASEGDHTADEVMNLPSLWRQAKRAALLMSRLSREAAR